MAYTSLTDLTDRYGARLLISLTDRDTPPAGAVDTDVIDEALADTDALIDGYLANRYKLPMDATPPLVADIAKAVAIYKLHVYSPDQKIKDDYDTALRQLREIGTGAIKLPIAGAEPEDTGGGGARMTDRERPFTEANMKGFI
ncbi:MAG: DUF1320 domain-containing protein [Rhodobacteraceae bacterium]|nr:MAG: DUF1320 domain-containing protein [Paracoccaceae bacterium]